MAIIGHVAFVAVPLQRLTECGAGRATCTRWWRCTATCKRWWSSKATSWTCDRTTDNAAMQQIVLHRDSVERRSAFAIQRMTDGTRASSIACTTATYNIDPSLFDYVESLQLLTLLLRTALRGAMLRSSHHYSLHCAQRSTAAPKC